MFIVNLCQEKLHTFMRQIQLLLHLCLQETFATKIVKLDDGGNDGSDDTGDDHKDDGCLMTLNECKTEENRKINISHMTRDGWSDT